MRAAAWGFVREKAKSKGNKGGVLKPLYFSRKGVRKMPTKSNNTGGRGGARPGAGRKKSAVKEKAENGNPGGRKLEVLDIPEVEGVDMPKPHEFYPPSSVTEARSRRRKFIRKPGSG